VNAIAENGYDAIIFFDPNCHRSLTGTWHNTTADPVEACILPVQNDPILIVHANTKTVVEKETWIKDIRERVPFPLSFDRAYETQTLANIIAKVLKEIKQGNMRIAVDENRTPLSIVHDVKKFLPDASFDGVASILDSFLGVRSTEEVELLRTAAKIGDAGMKAALDAVRPGRRECEVASECIQVMSAAGSDRLWFPLCVCSGVRSGIPYAYATEKVIEKGELVQLDFGPVYQGCYADISRIQFAGEHDDKQRRLYKTVLEANQAAIAAIKPGVTAGEIDRISRQIIDKAGYANYPTTHHTGHPVGFIYGPELEPTNKTVLKEGMTFTIEPGIYIPSAYGIRIEDNVLVNKSGCEVLTHVEKISQ
jgi:Xaa-Pro aminopeptidase